MNTEKISPVLLGIILATGIMSFAGIVSETAMNVTFPTLMKEFHINTSTVQWLTTGYLLVLALTIPVSSFLKHNISMRTLFLSAISLFILATLFCSHLLDIALRTCVTRRRYRHSSPSDVQYHFRPCS